MVAFDKPLVASAIIIHYRIHRNKKIPALNVLTHQNRNLFIIQYFTKYHL